MTDTAPTTCPKCGSASFNRQPTGSACFDCGHRELDDQTSRGWTRVPIGTCACGADFGTRACPISVVTTLANACTQCGVRRASTVWWMLGRAAPVHVFEDRPAIAVRT